MVRLVSNLVLSVILVLAACEQPTSPEASVPTLDAVRAEAAHATNRRVGVERAEFVNGFCSVAFLIEGEFVVFTGASRSVTTASGNTNYTCKGGLLIGDGAPETVKLRDVSFFDFSFDIGPRIIEPCSILVTPGPNGRLSVSCHVTPRGGQVVILE